MPRLKLGRKSNKLRIRMATLSHLQTMNTSVYVHYQMSVFLFRSFSSRRYLGTDSDIVVFK